MSNDAMLYQNVLAELRGDPRLIAADIGIAVDQGIVTLSGHVGVHSAKAAAVRAAERIRGVRGVVNELIVRPSAANARTDKQIAEAVLYNLKWYSEIPEDRVQVRIEQGWVILEGTVDWHHQREAAASVVHNLYGVKGFTNLLRIAPREVSEKDVKEGIQAAIRRSADEDAERISIEAEAGKVTLRGTVRTWMERQQAEGAAWNSLGVTAVDNLIVVEPDFA